MDNFFSALVMTLGEAFRSSVTEVTIAAYESALSDLPRDRLKQAAQRALRESKFMPTVAELRDLASRGVVERTSNETLERIRGYAAQAAASPCGKLLPQFIDAKKRLAEEAAS